MQRGRCGHRGARPALWRGSPGSAPLTPICPGRSSAKAAPSPTRSPSHRAVTVHPHHQHVLSRGFTQVPWSRPWGAVPLCPAPTPGGHAKAVTQLPEEGRVVLPAGQVPPGTTQIQNHRGGSAPTRPAKPRMTFLLPGVRQAGEQMGQARAGHTRPSMEASIRLQDHPGHSCKAPAQMLLAGVPQCGMMVGGRAPSQPTYGGLGPGPASSTQAQTPWEHPGGRAPAPATSRQSGPS